MKTSKIIPIYKKGSWTECSNYRPISLLPNIDKILKRLMFDTLCNFLGKNVLIFSIQFEFQQKYSTTPTHDKIRNETDNYGCGIFVNFWKAFAMVDHHILQKKLEHHGIRGNSNKRFASYLNSRLQFVSINGSNSNQTDVKCGVCQGSILGPLSLLIFINDLHLAIKNSEVHHFVDDTNLMLTVV